MKFRRDLIIVALTTFCLTSTLFMVATTRSADSPNWDPWADIKEDGTVDIYDAITLANAYGSSGETPKNVNVTNWPYWMLDNASGTSFKDSLVPQTLILTGGAAILPNGSYGVFMMSWDKPRLPMTDIYGYVPPATYSLALNASFDQIERTITPYEVSGTVVGSFIVLLLNMHPTATIVLTARGTISVGKIMPNGTRLVAYSENITSRTAWLDATKHTDNPVNYMFDTSAPLTMNVGDRLFVNIMLEGKTTTSDIGGHVGLSFSDSSNNFTLMLPVVPIQ
jgi:hypothetical protein